jgi:predicted glycosyltransferase
MVPRPCILASVRDILAPPSKPERAAEAEATIAAFYDGVLVHSDPEQTPLSASWPVSPALESRLHYTGYIAPPPPEPKPGLPGTGEIVVSAGGGDVGAALYETAIAAAAQRPDRRWRLLIGGGRAVAEIARLQSLAAAVLGAGALGADARVIIEPARPEFRDMLCNAAASVSLCGYNTALDLLAAGTPGVFVPFDAGAEVEQGIRAHQLAKRPHFAVVPNASLQPETLLAALDGVLAAGHFGPDRRILNGAARSVEIAQSLCHAH